MPQLKISADKKFSFGGIKDVKMTLIAPGKLFRRDILKKILKEFGHGKISWGMYQHIYYRLYGNHRSYPGNHIGTIEKWLLKNSQTYAETIKHLAKLGSVSRIRFTNITISSEKIEIYGLQTPADFDEYELIESLRYAIL